MVSGNINKQPVVEVGGRILLILLSLFVFFVSISLISKSFGLIGESSAHEFLRVARNPFVALFVGMLSTAIVQSSSTTTSIIVALVASGHYSINEAVPAIMGANIGTSVTSTIVAFGHITKPKKYKRAIAAASVHDFFNILLTIILFPLEYFFGILSKASIAIVGLFGDVSASTATSFSLSLKPIVNGIIDLFQANAIVLIPLSILLLFGSLQLFMFILKGRLFKEDKKYFNKVVFRSPMRSFIFGLGLTALLQSSSVTTSFAVPLVATKRTSIKRVFPFLMGANIGTTITAFLAAITVSKIAIAAAVAHFLFNLIGVLLFFPVRRLRRIPLVLAERLGSVVERNQAYGFVYIICTFFLLPFVLILISGHAFF